MTRAIALTLAVLCALAVADVSMSGGPWQWTETGAGLQVTAQGGPVISRELVQLIDRSTGWGNVAIATGPGLASQSGRLDDGRAGTFYTLRGKLVFRREVWVENATLNIRIECELVDPAPATDVYYSLEIPSETLAGGAWRAEAGGFLTGAAFTETRSAGTLVDPVESLSLLAPPTLLTLRAEAQGANWSFQEWRSAPHDCYRIRVEVPAKQGARWSGQLALALEATGLTPDRLLEPIRDQARERLSLAHRGELVARAVTCITGSPAVGQPCELLADIDCTFDDPFDPGDVAVTAEVTTSSKTYTLPGFYTVPFERQTKGETDVVTQGDPEWRVRFLPTEAGEHRVTVRVQDRNGTADAPELSITVGEADWTGLLRVSEANPLALAWEFGEGFYPLGVNIFEQTALGKPLPPGRIDRCKGYVERLAAAHGNFIRLRMDSWWFAVDNPPDVASGYMGAGRFNQRACWDIDRLMQTCEDLGVQVMLCLENANATVNSPREAWRQRYNTYAKTTGGPCETMAEFWTDETARELFRRKIRYCVARWGASPSLAMWEFFNEEVIGRNAEPAPIIAWHEEMAAEFKRLDPHRRIVTTSPMGERDPEANIALWALPDLEVAQVHDYAHTNTAGIYDTAQHGVDTFGEPFIVGEFGMQGGAVRSGSFKHGDDPDGLVAHLGRWSVAMSQGMGALDWYVSNYVDALDLWDDFAHLSAFISDLPRADPELECVEIGEIHAAPGRLLAAPGDVALHPRESWEKAPDSRFSVSDDGSVANEDALNAWLWGTQNHVDLRNPPTFVLDYPRAGTFTVHVMEVVGRGSNPVRITLDGEAALEEDLVCEEGKGEKWEVRQPGPDGNVAVWYNTDLTVDVPAGQHEVSVENLGRDRCSVQYRLHGYATRERVPGIRVLGLRHPQGAHVWMHNSSWSADAILNSTPVIPAREVTVSLRGLRDGPVEIEWWNPLAGEVLRTESGTVADGTLTLTVGDLERDLACKIRYRG